jgi:hypothetical protein
MLAKICDNRTSITKIKCLILQNILRARPPSIAKGHIDAI